MRDHLVAVVVPELYELASAAFERGIERAPDDWSDQQKLEFYCKSDELNRIVAADLIATGHEQQLDMIEIPRRIHLHATPFTFSNGLLTSSLKVRRPGLEQFFAAQLKQMYQASECEYDDEQDLEATPSSLATTYEQLMLLLTKRLGIECFDPAAPLMMDSLSAVRLISCLKQVMRFRCVGLQRTSDDNNMLHLLCTRNLESSWCCRR
jgi:hypothetical protein